MGEMNRPHLLLAESPGHYSVLRCLLETLDCTVTRTAAVAEAAAALLDAAAFDLVVIHHVDPCWLDTFAEAIWQAGGGPRVPVLALLPETPEPDTARPWYDDYLVHPLDPNLLRLRLRTLLLQKEHGEELAAELRRLAEIGIALTGEHDLNRLLERILAEARAISCAEAGTLYTLDASGVLRFQIVQNERLGTQLGGESGERLDLPPVPVNATTVSGYVALTGESINIPDVYAADGFDFSGPRRYDALTGYHSQSMLVVPLRNLEDGVIGVLQLINARCPVTARVRPFPVANVERTRALASQAGVALTNARLITDLKELLEGLIQTMATLIDEKSHYTAGHVRRVTRLGLLLAEAVNGCEDDRFGGRCFSAEELNELRVAGLLHDIGKVVVPEHVIDKATKLHGLVDRIGDVRTRFSVIRRGLENEALRQQLALARSGACGEALSAVDARLAVEVRTLQEDLAFLEHLNLGCEHVEESHLERLHAIAARTYVDDAGQTQPYLTAEEARNLGIVRGTLLPEELERIRHHAEVSVRLLRQIPFSRKLRNVALIAGDHHEMLNGSGYPSGKTGAQLPLQSRILAVADIFDALTAADRPYKKAYPPEQAFQILREEAARGRLDVRLVELLIASNCHARLACEGEAEDILPDLPAPPPERPLGTEADGCGAYLPPLANVA